jgi:hypothetical protein
VRDNLPRLIAAAEDLESGTSHLPRFVVEELKAFVDCGDPIRGFVRATCSVCHQSVIVGFACRASICPSCGARRMEDGAKHILSRVLPDVPVRQWVLSLPFSLRAMVGYDADLFASVTRIFMSEVFRHLRRKGRDAGAARPLCAGIAVLQRAGNALDMNPHVHAIVVDGAFRERASQDTLEPDLELVELSPPGDEDLVNVSRRVCNRFLDLLRRRGFADAERLCPLERAPPMGTLIEAAARVRSRFAHVDEDGNVWPMEEHLAGGGRTQAGAHRGFSTDASVAAPIGDLARRTRIVRYALKPPVAEDQFRDTRDGRIAMKLHRPRRSGATHLVLHELDLVKKLAAIIAPPGRHGIRYFGALASASKHRRHVVPPPPLDLALPAVTVAADASTMTDTKKPRRTPWLALLAKVYGTDATICPSCGLGRLRVISKITDASVIRRILEHIEERRPDRAAIAEHDLTLPAP